MTPNNESKRLLAEDSEGTEETGKETVGSSCGQEIMNSKSVHVNTDLRAGEHGTSEEDSKELNNNIVVGSTINDVPTSQMPVQIVTDGEAVGVLPRSANYDEEVILPADTSMNILAKTAGKVDCSSKDLSASDNGAKECRICQEEDVIANLESPCVCAGSLKYAHKKCVQRWCNEKGDANCEICHTPYTGDYQIAPRRQLLSPDEIPWELREELSSAPFGRRPILAPDSRVYAVRDGDHVYLEVEYDDVDPTEDSSSSWCRSLALMLLALLLLRHAFAPVGGPSDDDEGPDMFTLLVFRIIGILIPCYIMARAISLLRQAHVDRNVQLRAANSTSATGESEASAATTLRPEERLFISPPVPLVQNQA